MNLVLNICGSVLQEHKYGKILLTDRKKKKKAI